jgi:Co/Zn/Cd efflux system component
VTISIATSAIISLRQLLSSSTEMNHHEPNLYIILGFSIVNLLLDMINIYFFAQPRSLSCCCGCWHRRYQDKTNDMLNEDIIHNKCLHRQDDVTESEEDDALDHVDGTEMRPSMHQRSHHHSEDSHPTRGHNRTTNNLNMCSALTHVLADTFRSLAVIIAIVLALNYGIDPAVADSAAALFVSFLILVSLIPLIQGLYGNVCELRSMRKTEQSWNTIIGT